MNEPGGISKTLYLLWTGLIGLGIRIVICYIPRMEFPSPELAALDDRKNQRKGYFTVPLKKKKFKKYISEEVLKKTDLKKSKIIRCIVKTMKGVVISDDTKYRTVLNNMYKFMRSKDIDIQKITEFNMKKTNENGLNGYKWYPELNLSIQGKDATYTMKEILNMIKVNNYSIKITIQLETKKIIKFKLNI